MNPGHLPVALLLGAGWVALAVGAHFAILHLAAVQRRARTLVGLFAVAALAHLLSAIALGLNDWRVLAGLVVIGCGFVLYMPFYYAIATSQSVRMLIALLAAPGGLTRDDLRAQFPLKALLSGRLETLVRSGYLRRVEGDFALTAKGRLMARSFSWVKALWRLGPGG